LKTPPVAILELFAGEIPTMTRRKESTARAGDSGKLSSPVVLIVDDEADILELLEMTLVRMGLEVERAMNIRDATHLLDSHHFDLCLTDMRLPDGEGLELVRHIGNHCADLPVAIITAHGNTENAVTALKEGAFDYLAKPVSLEQLRALVKSALNLPPPQAKTVRRISANAATARDGRKARAQPGAGLYQRRIRQRQGARRKVDTWEKRPP